MVTAATPSTRCSSRWRIIGSASAVLLAVSPDQSVIEVVYGAQVRGRGAESAAPLGVAAASSAFEQGHLVDGLVSAIRVLSAGISPA